MTLIQPHIKDEELLADISNALPRGGLCVWWLGQSGFLVKSDHGQVLFDPYLSDSLTEKYAATDKPHERMTEIAVDPGKLRGIDIITSTHNHTDHLDASTLLPVLAVNPRATLVIPEANRDFVADRLDCEPNWPLGMTDGDTVEIHKLFISAVPAAHNDIERDSNGNAKFLGYVVRFGGLTVYHSGDTLVYPEMVSLLEPFDIDLAMLPINGNRPERRVAGNLFGEEAAQLAFDIDARLVVPCHYDMFTFNTESPQQFVGKCQSLRQPFRVLQCGERLDIAAPDQS